MKSNHNLKRLEQLTMELTAEDEMMSVLNGIANMYPDEEMYERTLNVVLQVTRSKYGVFGYIDTNGVFVCPSMTKSVWKQCQVVDKDQEFPPETWGDSIWGRSIRQKKSLYSNEPFNVPDGHIPINRALMVPVMYHNVVIGLFEVANKEEDYTEEDVRLLELIAKNIAPILNGRLRSQQSEQKLLKMYKRLEMLEGRLPSNAG